MTSAKEFWDSASGNYDRTEARFEYIHEKAREFARKFLEPSHVVLDYGCGTGTTACQLSGCAKEIQAIDISPQMIEIARQKAQAQEIDNVDFQPGVISDRRLQAESFDVILAFNVLHTVPDPEDVVTRLVELLKPGGLLISVTPCLRGKLSPVVNIQIQLVRVLCRLGVIPVPIRRLKSRDLDRLLSHDQLTPVEATEVYRGATSYFHAARKDR